ncbi:MAG: PQQ-binding-like beta-propeller repeat protein [Gemmataceae bacterium]|nr:PQQ-binding-like beta-propeller repeat protein [Gemmataceae bacterium]
MRAAWLIAMFVVTVPRGLLQPVVAPAADWRAFRGNDGTGVSREQGLPLTWSLNDNIRWKTDLPGAGSSTPIIVGDRVYVTCYSGYNVPGQPKGRPEDLRFHLICLARSDGKILWQREIQPKLPEQDNIRDGHGYASNTPAADDERVYAFFGKTGVFAFDHQGKQQWHADVGSRLHGWGSGASLLNFEDRIIVNASVESETLYALRSSDGQVAWKRGGIKESWNTPIIAHVGGRPELVVAIQGQILGIDPRTGTDLWNCATDIPWYMVPSLVAQDGVAYAIGGRPGAGLAVRLGGKGDVTRTHRLWTSDKGGNVSSPIYHDGHLYWMHDSLGTAFCAEVKTGRIVYQVRVPRAGQVYGSPVLAEGRIYYPSRSGTVFVIAAKPKFELLASNSWGERGEFNSSPAIADGCLFFRTDRFIVCLGKK